VVLNTTAAERTLQARYPELASRTITVMNGADGDPLPQASDDGRFMIAFVGTLYVGRNPRTLFRAVSRVVRELALTPASLSVEFMGSEASVDVPLSQMAAEEGIAEFFTAHATRPRSEALAFLARAAVLVSLPQDVRRALPAKLFEYVRFPAWVLVLTERDTASELLFRNTAADVVAPDDVEGIAAVIRARYEQFRRTGRPTPLNADGRFDRRPQAMLLLDAIDRLVEPTNGR
jgi:hypothetical protein